MTSRLVQMQARFQQKQIQEKEEKLVRLYENQQQKTFERVSRGSAGSNSSLGSTGGGKVRQMFDERRQKAGVDRSYPLEPLRSSKSTSQGASLERTKNSTTGRTVIKSTLQKSVSHVKNGKPSGVNTREIVHSTYYNNDNDQTYKSLEYDNCTEKCDTSLSNFMEIINSHNLNDTLDKEEMPAVNLIESDELYISGKLANLGGKLPSESSAQVTVKKQATTTGTNLGKTFRKETKPIVKRTVRPAVPPQNLSSSTSVHSQPSKSITSPFSSPVKTSVSQNMKSSSKASGSKKGNPQCTKAPSNTRPSAKQAAKSPVARDDLNECKFCSRRFAADRLEVHEAICSRTTKKKRKIYDATKHRVEGTELEQYVRKGAKNVKGGRQPPKKDWRRTHEDFINAIRAAKMAQQHVARGGKLTDLPPPPPSSNPDYVQCPHCGRKFNEAAAERHIPKCASYIFNKSKPGAQVSKGKAPSGKNVR